MPKPDPYLSIEHAAERTAAEYFPGDEAVDPIAIATQLGVMVKASEELEGFTGALLQHENQFTILYASHLRNPGFERFCVGHELGHYHLPDHPEALFRGGNRLHRSRAGSFPLDKYEREADHFAAGLIMPQGRFRRAMNSVGTGLAGVERLKERFGASLTATAIRFARLHDDGVAAIVCSDARVDFCFMSETVQSIGGIEWIQKRSKLPLNTATHEFWRAPQFEGADSRREHACQLSDWFDGAPDVEVEEDVIGLGRYNKSLTILHCIEAIPGV